MTPERIEQERAAFEAWLVERCPNNPQTERVGDEYSRLGTQYKWEGWQARAAQSEWISVEEELPDNGITVLTVTEEGFVSTNYLVEERGAAWDCIWRFDSTSSPITHWQPLPEPPKTAAASPKTQALSA